MKNEPSSETMNRLILGMLAQIHSICMPVDKARLFRLPRIRSRVESAELG